MVEMTEQEESLLICARHALNIALVYMPLVEKNTTEWQNQLNSDVDYVKQVLEKINEEINQSPKTKPHEQCAVDGKMRVR